MERVVFLCLAVTNILLCANSQNVVQKPNILYPDNIYFADNLPTSNGKSERPTNTLNLQPPYNDQSLVQAQVVPNVIETSTMNLNQFNPNFNTILNPSNIQNAVNNFNVVQQPVFTPVPNRSSQDVQRPAYDQNANTDQRIQGAIQTSNGQPRLKLDHTSAAFTNFSINVMRSTIRQNFGNLVVSPYSIATLLALLQQGATQQTLQQISEALQMPLDTSAAVFKSQTQDILSRSSRNILRTANNIYIADAFNLNPQFKIVAQRDFHSDVTPAVFSQPEQAARIINGWVASKTDQKIDKLITPEHLSVNTQMVLVNAIYFKGLWAVPFRHESTKTDVFHLRSGAVKKTPFMMIKRHFRAGIDMEIDAKFVILPFEFNEYSLMVILPSNQSSVDRTLESLSVAQLEHYLNYKPMEVALKIPKFTIKADTDLTPVLKQMGVTQIFEQNSGLVGLGMYRTFSPQVSSAIHSALLSIDEVGSEAAAASGFAVVALSNDEPSMPIKVDRPFIAVIWDEKTKVPLFIAKIEDPTL